MIKARVKELLDSWEEDYKFESSPNANQYDIECCGGTIIEEKNYTYFLLSNGEVKVGKWNKNFEEIVRSYVYDGSDEFEYLADILELKWYHGHAPR